MFSKERCKQCGICTHLCPTGAIGAGAEGMPTLVDKDACTSCRLCEHLCPDFAVSMVIREDAESAQRDESADDADRHPSSAPEVCHPFGACDG